MTTRLATPQKDIKPPRNHFVLCAKRNAQNESRMRGFISFCAPPKGAHTKRNEPETRVPRAANHVRAVCATLPHVALGAPRLANDSTLPNVATWCQRVRRGPRWDIRE